MDIKVKHCNVRWMRDLFDLIESSTFLEIIQVHAHTHTRLLCVDTKDDKLYSLISLVFL